MTRPTIFWFRRDLRLDDNPALNVAASQGPVIGLFINDDRLRKPSGAPRLAFLARSLGALKTSSSQAITIRSGRPEDVLLGLCQEFGATSVHATADFGPYGRERDSQVEAVLKTNGISTRYVDSPYAVEPASIVSGAGTPYKVFSPFFRAWKQHGWRPPAESVDIEWFDGVRSEALPSTPNLPYKLPVAGEQAANEALERFIDGPVRNYHERRDLPAVAGTSGLSAYLKWGTIHPRQILDRLGDTKSEDIFRSELAWREFYADVLFRRPDSARSAFVSKMAKMEVDEGDEADKQFEAWCQGQTGFPIVDAGMRQLSNTGWMHNRVRMIVASFLVKDLHIDWTRGAHWFMQHLVDGDLASNSHGWQWVAGTGTDASPYFRVFNPTTQSKKFDSAGEYIRRWVPELGHLSSKYIHAPASDPHGAPAGYPRPIVDHKIERLETLARYERLKQTWSQVHGR